MIYIPRTAQDGLIFGEYGTILGSSAITHRVGRETGAVDSSRGPVHPSAILTVMTESLAQRAVEKLKDDRGDVPGWVLITLMTAALVAGIWALAAPALSGLFENAINRVSGF